MALDLVWRAPEARTVAIVWKQSTAPLSRPGYHFIRCVGHVWFQFPWSRPSNYKKFLRAMLSSVAGE